MPRAKSAILDKFTGVDQRRPIYSADPRALWVGENVEITRGSTVRSAPIPRVEAELPEESIGLYAISGKLRAAVPAGHGLEDEAPVGFKFDPVSHLDESYGLEISASRYVRMHGVTSWSADSRGNGFPYFVLETSTGSLEHHYIDGTFKTRVALPFNPGQTLVKQSGKIFADNVSEGLVHFSSTVFGPREWRGKPGEVAENDAGFFDPTQYSAGDPRIRGLTYHGTQLVVFFEDAVQFWITDPDPRHFQFQRSLTGPGTPYFGSVQPVIHDLYYFAPSGFHSIQAVSAMGQTSEGDVGAPVFKLTEGFADGSYRVVRLWSQFRSQYICFFVKDGATTAFVRTVSPLGGTSGWTTWTYDFEVDYACENDNRVYLRSGDTVYRLDDSEPGETLGVTATLATTMVDGGESRLLKAWKTVDLELEGTIDTLTFRSDAKDTTKTWVGARNITGSTSPGGFIPILGMSHNLGVILETTKGFELSSLTMSYDELYGAG